MLCLLHSAICKLLRQAFPSPTKTVSGMQDSTSKNPLTWTNSLPPSNVNSTPDDFDTFLSEVLRSELDHTRTTTKSNMSTSVPSSTIEFPSHRSLKIGMSNKEMVTIWYHGTEISLTPDGKTTISKNSPKSTSPNAVFLSWENFPSTNPPKKSGSQRTREKA